MSGAHGEYRNPAGKAHVRQALERGRAQGLEWCAIYQPGEEVRCPGLPTEPDVCGGFLFVRGPAGEVHVRVYEERRAGDRRQILRPGDRRRGDEHRCPRHDHHRPDVEALGAAPSSAA